MNSNGRGRNSNVAPQFHAFGYGNTKDRKAQVRRKRFGGTMSPI